MSGEWRQDPSWCDTMLVATTGRHEGKLVPLRLVRTVSSAEGEWYNYRPFIPAPAVVEIIDDNRPMFRCFCLPLGGSRLLFPHSEMAEDTFHDIGIIEAYDLHLMAAAGTTERGGFPDFLDELSPGF